MSVDKLTMFRNLYCGQYGNRLRMWNSANELLESGYDGLVSVRTLGPVTGLVCRTELLVEEAVRLSETSAYPVVFSEQSPDEQIRIQGELRVDSTGYYLEYSTKKCPMRRALQQERLSEYEFRLPRIIESAFWYESLMDLYELFDTLKQQRAETYVVEFTSYHVCVGVVPNRNVVIWEVRDY